MARGPGEEEVREEEAREDGGGRAYSQAYAEVRVSVIAHHFVWRKEASRFF